MPSKTTESNRRLRPGLSLSAALLTLLALAPGCARKANPDGGPTDGPRTAEALLEMSHARPSLSTLQGTVRLRLETPGRNARLRGALLAQGPQNLRAEVLSIIGQPVAYLVNNETSLSLYSPFSNTHLTTDDPQAILDLASGSIISTPDLIGLFLGQVPTCELPRDHRLQNEGGSYSITCGDDEKTLNFDAETLLLRSITGQTTQGGVFQVLLDDHQEMEGAMVPHHIQFTAPTLGIDTELDYEDVVANAPLDPGLFVLTVPPGPETRDFLELLNKQADSPSTP